MAAKVEVEVAGTCISMSPERLESSGYFYVVAHSCDTRLKMRQ